MSVKKEVFGHLDKHPDSSLKELTTQMSDLNSSTVRRYFFEYKKGKTTAGKKSVKTAGGQSKKSAKGAVSLRNQILTYLDKHPDSNSGQLYDAFAGANRKTIRNYLHQWRVGRSKKISLGKVEQKVFQYLDNHPTINLIDLKGVFPDGGKKLITIFRNWKKGQETSEKIIKRKSAKPSVAGGGSVPQPPTIKSLKLVIEKQKVTIEQQRMRIKDLKAQLAKKTTPGLSGIKKILKNRLLRPKK